MESVYRRFLAPSRKFEDPRIFGQGSVPHSYAWSKRLTPDTGTQMLNHRARSIIALADNAQCYEDLDLIEAEVDALQDEVDKIRRYARARQSAYRARESGREGLAKVQRDRALEIRKTILIP